MLCHTFPKTRKTGRGVAGWNILYLRFGFRMGRRKVVCVAADRLIGVEGGTTADCVDVVFVQAVPDV
jgi:hypothetical protein